MAQTYRHAAYTDRAKELRHRMTPQEKHLWYDFLKTYPIHWYKQRIIYLYIVDFYCASAHLAVEIDGSQHYTEDGLAYDAERTQILQQCDIEVLRFTNQDVDCHFKQVCLQIDAKVKEKLMKS
jgi:very-short-patch-repair endonuclease